MAVDYRSKYKRLKGKLKYLVYEQECFLEEMRRTQKKLIRVSRDKSFLLDRLLKYEAIPPSSSDDDATGSSSNESEEEALKLSTPLKSRTKRQRADQGEDCPPAKQMSFSPEIKQERMEDNARLLPSENGGQFEVNRGVSASGSSGQLSVNKTVPPPAAATARMSPGLLGDHPRPPLQGKSSGKAGAALKFSSSFSQLSDAGGHRENNDEEYVPVRSRNTSEQQSTPPPHKASAKTPSTPNPGLSSVCKYIENGKQCTDSVNMKSKSPFCTYHRSVIRKKSAAQPSRLTLATSQMPSSSSSSSPHSSLSSSSSVTPPVPPLSSTLSSSQSTPDNDLHR